MRIKGADKCVFFIIITLHATTNCKPQKRFVQTTFLLSQMWLDFRHTGVNNDNLLSYLTDIWAHCNQNSCTLDPCIVLSPLYCALNIYFTMRSLKKLNIILWLNLCKPPYNVCPLQSLLKVPEYIFI